MTSSISTRRIAGRDIGGSDPERMAAPNVEKYVEELFRGSSVRMEVVSDLATLEKEYPLFAAVNRCASRNGFFSLFPKFYIAHFFVCVKILYRGTSTCWAHHLSSVQRERTH